MKALIIGSFFLVIVAVIIVVILFTTWGLGQIEKYIDNHSKESWAPSRYHFVGKVFFFSFRERHALRIFEKIMEKYPDYSDLPDVYYKRASCYQEMNMKYDAINAFNEFADKFPDHPDATEARRRAGLIRYAH